MRKSTAVVLSAAVALSLTACGPNNAAAESTLSSEPASFESTAAPETSVPETAMPETSLPAQPAAPAAMSEEELAPIRALFEADYSWYSQALTSYYETAADVSFRELFYNGNLDCFWNGEEFPNITEEELQYLRDHTDHNPDDYHVDCTVISRADMETVLQTLFGLSIDETNQVQMDSWLHDPNTDRYFHFHGDTNAMIAHITDGLRLDDHTVELHYLGGFNEVCTVVMEEQDDHWYILSNATTFDYDALWNDEEPTE